MDGRKIDTEEQMELEEPNAFDERISDALIHTAYDLSVLEQSRTYSISQYLLSNAVMAIILCSSFIMEYFWQKDLFASSGSLLIACALASAVHTEQMNRIYSSIHNYSFSRTMKREIELSINSRRIDAYKQSNNHMKDLVSNIKNLHDENIEEEEKYKLITDRLAQVSHFREIKAAILGTLVWGYGHLITEFFMPRRPLDNLLNLIRDNTNAVLGI